MRLLIATWAVCAALLVAGSAQGDPACAAWAGEFDPLPTVSDPDPLRARWARLRVDQLGQLASRAEPRDREEANRLWQRVRCLEPDSAAARAGIERTQAKTASRAPEPRPPERSASVEPRPRKVETPKSVELVRRKPETPKSVEPEQRKPRAPERAAVVAERERPPVPARAKPTPSVAAPLDRSEALIRAARFDDALGEIERLRPEAMRADERARLEVLAATAQVAFGDDGAARASLQRALSANPGLALDERTTSPKLLRVLEAARGDGADPTYAPAAGELKPLAEATGRAVTRLLRRTALALAYAGLLIGCARPDSTGGGGAAAELRAAAPASLAVDVYGGAVATGAEPPDSSRGAPDAEFRVLAHDDPDRVLASGRTGRGAVTVPAGVVTLVVQLDPIERIGPFRLEPGVAARVRVIDTFDAAMPSRIWRIERGDEVVGRAFPPPDELPARGSR